MRFLMHVTFPHEPFNKFTRDGKMGQKMGQLLEATKPEAAYFCAMNGKRGGFLVVDLKEPSDMARYAEPWFLSLNADVEFLPAMTPEDIQKANLDDIGKSWR